MLLNILKRLKNGGFSLVFNAKYLSYFYLILVCVFYSSKLPYFIFSDPVKDVISDSLFLKVSYVFLYFISFYLVFVRSFLNGKLGIVFNKIVVNYSIIFFNLVAFISVFWSVDSYETFERSMGLVGTVFICLYIFIFVKIEDFIFCFLIGFFIVALGSWFLLIVNPELAFHQIGPLEGTMKGVHFHKNQLGITSVLTVIFSYHYIKSKYSSRKIFPVITMTLAFFLILFSNSMTSLLLMLMMAFLYRILSFFNKRDLLGYFVVYCILFISCFLFLIVYSGIWLDILAYLDKDPTLSSRIPIWSITWDYIREKLFFGYGYNSFWDQDSIRVSYYNYMIGFQPAHVHNGYLNVILDFGLFGFLVFLFVFYKYLYGFFNSKFSGNHDYVLFSAVFVLFCFVNLTETKILVKNDIIWMLFCCFFMWINSLKEASRRGEN